jgi:hypothetical protein
MQLMDFFKIVSNRITSGSEYLWSCYGNDMYSLSYWNNYDDVEISCVYSTKTMSVFEITAYDYYNSLSYRWIHPEYRVAYQNESTQRDIKDTAWDDVVFTNLETEADITEKASAIALCQ